jgi:hypothetical protein
MLNKPGIERQILYDFTYLWNLKKAELIEAKNKMVVTKHWSGRDELSQRTQNIS